MREVIAKNEYYEIEVDREKNRSYSKYKGYWKSVDAVSEYLNDIQRMIGKLKPNFTTLLDIRDETGFKVPPPEVINLMVEAQKNFKRQDFQRAPAW